MGIDHFSTWSTSLAAEASAKTYARVMASVSRGLRYIARLSLPIMKFSAETACPGD